MKALMAAAAMLGLCSATQQAAGETIADPTTVDVCKRLPGADVAAALGGLLKQARPLTTDSSSRCAYLLAPAGKPEETAPGVVVWLYRAGDYDELAKYTEGTTENVPNLGDAAMRFRDPGDGLYKLRVVKRGQFALEAVASDPVSARKLAELALARFTK